MVARRNARRRKSGITLDLSDYDPDGADFGSGSGGFHIPDGIYGIKVESVEQKESNSGNQMLEWIFVGTSGKAKGKKFWLYTVLDDPQKIGKTLEALGIEFEAGEFDFDPDDAVDAECFGEVVTEKYEGQKRSKLKRVMAEEDGGEEGDEGEEDDDPPARSARGRANGRAAKKKAAKLGEDEIKAMSEDELEELVDKHELEVDLAKAKTLSKKRNVVLEAMTENDLIA